MSIELDEVDNCNTCPFSHYTGILWWCMHPTVESRKLKLSTNELQEGETPEWCPLKENPVFVRWRGTPKVRDDDE